MKDLNGRVIDYLRISLTDRCNLKCVYCMPEGSKVKCLSQEELLTKEEILMLIQTVAQIGIKKVKLTGGEPLLRKDLVEIIRGIKQVAGIEEVTLTTNGILLPWYAKELVEAGLDGVNLSLDTMDTQAYQALTGYDGVDQVLLGLKKLQEAGLKNIKINVVPLQQMEEQDLLSLIQLAKKQQIAVRFIELMPIGGGKQFVGIKQDEIIEKIEKYYGPLKSYEQSLGNGPAKYYTIEEFEGKIGFIHAVSNHFCSQCNRIRITCSGEIKPCLHYQKGINLKPYFNQQEKLKEVIKEAIWNKPSRHAFENQEGLAELLEERMMSQIGG